MRQLVFAFCLSCVWSLAASAQPLFLLDDTVRPRASISWPTRSGERVFLEAEVDYTSANKRTGLAHNVEMFVAAGGTRLDRGIGHPRGGIVRVGFYKTDNDELFFKDLADNGSLSITLGNVKFNQDPSPRMGTVLQHCKYTEEDIVACGLSADQIDLYNTVNPDDDLEGKITEENGRLGGLDGSASERGRIELRVEDDGTITMKATIPYAMLRHVRDPWIRAVPGGFFEPYHFHVEFETLPVSVARAEDSADTDEESEKGAVQDED